MLKNCQDEQPTKDHYWLFHNRNGTEEYFHQSMNTYYRYISLYGIPNQLWTYEPPKEAIVYNPEPRFWIMEILTKNDGWLAVRPTGGKPYKYNTENEAWRMLNICYPDCSPDEVRVRDVVEWDYNRLP